MCVNRTQVCVNRTQASKAKLARFLRMPGGELVTRSDLQYALQCGVGKLPAARVDTLMRAFEGDADAGGLKVAATGELAG